MRVLYITDTFPSPSQTFISREIVGLEHLGLELAILSLQYQNASDPIHAINKGIKARIFYSPDLQISVTKKALYHLHDCATNPIRYIRTMQMSHVKGLSSMQYMYRQMPVYRRLVHACGAQHLHAHFGRDGLLLAWLAGSMLDMSFSVTLHGSDILVDPYPALGEVLQQAKLVICVSNQIRHKVVSQYGIKPERVVVIRCGINPEDFQHVTVFGDRLKILSVARLHPVKGLSDLIAACALLRDKGVDFECTIVGDGQERDELQTQVKTLGLTEYINLPGWVENEKLPEIYHNHTVFVLPSSSEGVPVVIMEAMASGLPIVATGVGGVPEIVEQGVNGALVEPHQPAMIADAVMNLSNMHPAEKQRMADRNRQKIQSDFNCNHEVQKLYRIFASDAAH